MFVLFKNEDGNDTAINPKDVKRVTHYSRLPDMPGGGLKAWAKIHFRAKDEFEIVTEPVAIVAARLDVGSD